MLRETRWPVLFSSFKFLFNICSYDTDISFQIKITAGILIRAVSEAVAASFELSSMAMFAFFTSLVKCKSKYYDLHNGHPKQDEHSSFIPPDMEEFLFYKC